MIKELLAAWDERTAAEADRIQARLHAALESWLAMGDHRQYLSGLAGSPEKPGVYDDVGSGDAGPRWVAWDYDPTDDDSPETIAVYVEDLAAAVS